MNSSQKSGAPVDSAFYFSFFVVDKLGYVCLCNCLTFTRLPSETDNVAIEILYERIIKFIVNEFNYSSMKNYEKDEFIGIIHFIVYVFNYS